MLMESERLASLGQLIGGIAHNLKNTNNVNSRTTEGIDDLIKEYDASIDNPQVTSQDHHDITKDMNSWTIKIKEYTAYMSDIITAVKGQAVVMSEADNVTFDIEELVKRVKHTNETRTKKRHSIPKCNNESPRTHNITET